MGGLFGRRLGGFGEVKSMENHHFCPPIASAMHYKFRKRPTLDHPLSQHSITSFEKSLKKVSKKLHFRQRIPNYLPDLESCPGLPGLARTCPDLPGTASTGSWDPRYTPSRAPVSIHREPRVYQTSSRKRLWFWCWCRCRCRCWCSVACWCWCSVACWCWSWCWCWVGC